MQWPKNAYSLTGQGPTRIQKITSALNIPSSDAASRVLVCAGVETYFRSQKRLENRAGSDWERIHSPLGSLGSSFAPTSQPDSASIWRLLPRTLRPQSARSTASDPRKSMQRGRQPQKPLTLRNRQEYWRANLRLMAALLAIWFAVSYGCGILFVDQLDRFQIGGFRLGFWFAQQGSIYVFVILIFVYVWRMNQLDRKFNVDE